MRRTKLHEYQNSYAKAMKPFGLQRGIVGSTAKHQANSEYYRQQVIQYEEDIAKLQADVEKAQEGRNTILAWFGKGDLSKAKKELADKDRLIAELNKQIEELQAERYGCRNNINQKSENCETAIKRNKQGHSSGGSGRMAVQGEGCNHR